MHRARSHSAICLVLCAALPAICLSQNVYLKEMPKPGEIPPGKVVYVDDGTCPTGEVKEIVGGSREQEIPRRVRCVKRPDASPSK